METKTCLNDSEGKQLFSRHSQCLKKPIMTKLTKQEHLLWRLIHYILLMQLHLANVKDFEIELDVS